MIMQDAVGGCTIKNTKVSLSRSVSLSLSLSHFLSLSSPPPLPPSLPLYFSLSLSLACANPNQKSIRLLIRENHRTFWKLLALKQLRVDANPDQTSIRLSSGSTPFGGAL